MPEFDEVLTREEAAKVLKISTKTLGEMIKQRRLIGTYMLIGKKELRFRRSKLLNYIGTEVPDIETFQEDCCDYAAEEAE